MGDEEGDGSWLWCVIEAMVWGGSYELVKVVAICGLSDDSGTKVMKECVRFGDDERGFDVDEFWVSL